MQQIICFRKKNLALGNDSMEATLYSIHAQDFKYFQEIQNWPPSIKDKQLYYHLCLKALINLVTIWSLFSKVPNYSAAT